MLELQQRSELNWQMNKYIFPHLQNGSIVPVYENPHKSCACGVLRLSKFHLCVIWLHSNCKLPGTVNVYNWVEKNAYRTLISVA